MKIAQSIYYNSPIPMQNILASLQGYFLERMRHGGDYLRYCTQIKERSKWPYERFIEYQNYKFVELIKYAYEHVPFYRAKFRELNIDPNEIKGVRDISRFPLLSKEEVRLNNGFLRSKDSLSVKDMTIHTTGTTGTPLQIFCNDRARQLNYSFFNSYVESIGIDLSRKKATIGGRVVVHPEQNAPPFWRHSYSTKNLFLSSYHLQQKNLLSYVNTLRDFKAPQQNLWVAFGSGRSPRL